MTVQLLLFGITKDIIGGPNLQFETRPDIKAGDLLREIVDEYPPLRDLNSIALAVNGVYAEEETPISSSDELALIPPVSGG